MQELKPCPFCGQVPKVDEYKDTFGRVFYSVDCNNELCEIQPFTDGFRTQRKAVNSWNKRKGE